MKAFTAVPWIGGSPPRVTVLGGSRTVAFGARRRNSFRPCQFTKRSTGHQLPGTWVAVVLAGTNRHVLLDKRLHNGSRSNRLPAVRLGEARPARPAVRGPTSGVRSSPLGGRRDHSVAGCWRRAIVRSQEEPLAARLPQFGSQDLDSNQAVALVVLREVDGRHATRPISRRATLNRSPRRLLRKGWSLTSGTLSRREAIIRDMNSPSSDRNAQVGLCARCRRGRTSPALRHQVAGLEGGLQAGNEEPSTTMRPAERFSRGLRSGRDANCWRREQLRRCFVKLVLGPRSVRCRPRRRLIWARLDVRLALAGVWPHPKHHVVRH